jgi:dTDP-4-dehydrorhamnose reductase
MRILLIGRDGQVGWELERCLQGLGQVTALGRAQLDLTDGSEIGHVLDAVCPEVIVSAAAYTAVDRAESETCLAFAINAEAPSAMARWAQTHDAVLIHYSSDYVFDGSGSTPWRETDAPRPLSVYGASKLAGERAIAEAGCTHLILRTSWVYAARGGNFLRTMLRLACERDELRVVHDQVGAPTWARTLAQATALILARCGATQAQRIAALSERGGIFHLAARGECSWFRFAERIFELCPNPKRRLRSLVPIPTSEYPTAARRPLNSRLALDRVESTWNLSLPEWDAALRLCAAELTR